MTANFQAALDSSQCFDLTEAAITQTSYAALHVRQNPLEPSLAHHIHPNLVIDSFRGTILPSLEGGTGCDKSEGRERV